MLFAIGKLVRELGAQQRHEPHNLKYLQKVSEIQLRVYNTTCITTKETFNKTPEGYKLHGRHTHSRKC